HSAAPPPSGRAQRHLVTLLRPTNDGYKAPATPSEKINLERVQHVAKRARLALPKEKLQTLAQQLESILEYVAKIGQVDVTGVEPMAHALPISNVFREDIPEPALPLEKVLQNAPDVDG